MQNEKVNDFEDLPNTVFTRYGVFIALCWISILYFGLSQTKFTVRLATTRSELVGNTIEIQTGTRDGYLINRHSSSSISGKSETGMAPHPFRVRDNAYSTDCNCYRIVLSSRSDKADASKWKKIKYFEIHDVPASEILISELFFRAK